MTTTGAVLTDDRVARRLRGDRRVWIATSVLLCVALSAILAPLLAPYNPTENLGVGTLNNLRPSLQHPLGTDPYSRDVLSRMLFGTRISVSIALAAVTLAVSFGTLVGVVSGYFGGVVDTILMRLVDASLSIPTLLLLLAVIALWGDVGPVALTLLIASVGWFQSSRLVRAETLVVRNADYIVAARALGTSSFSVIRRHVLPNVIAPAIIAGTLAVGNIILLEAGLSYLGIGVRPPTPSWGSIIQDGSERVADLWWLTVFPGLAILVTVFAFNALGDALRDALDPRQLDSSFGRDTTHRSG